MIAFHIDPGKCQACMICSGNKRIHVTDYEKCTNRGTWFEVCPTSYLQAAYVSTEALAFPPPASEVVPEE